FRVVEGGGVAILLDALQHHNTFQWGHREHAQRRKRNLIPAKSVNHCLSAIELFVIASGVHYILIGSSYNRVLPLEQSIPLGLGDDDGGFWLAVFANLDF